MSYSYIYDVKIAPRAVSFNFVLVVLITA